MTVAEFIEKLKKVPQDMTVYIPDYEWGIYEYDDTPEVQRLGQFKDGSYFVVYGRQEAKVAGVVI